MAPSHTGRTAGALLSVVLLLLATAGQAHAASASLLGGKGDERAAAIVHDGQGNTYVAGTTDSPDFPSAQAPAGADVFVAKYDAAGTLLHTFVFGGPGRDTATGLAIDTLGALYVTGIPGTGFPTTPGAVRSEPSGAFLVKLTPAGDAVAYSTYLDLGDPTAVAVGPLGDAYVAGASFTQLGSTDTRNRDAVVERVDPLGASVSYRAAIGGSQPDFATDVAVDALGQAYVTGGTVSADLPVTPGAAQTTFGGGPSGDGFVAKLSPTGAPAYVTYLGGSYDDTPAAIAVDATGAAYVAGITASRDFPVTSNAFQPASYGDYDAFATKLDPTGAHVDYGTYLGGDELDAAGGIAPDGTGGMYVVASAGDGTPTTPGAAQPRPASLSLYDSNRDAYVVHLRGGVLEYATFLGGTGDEFDTAIAVDPGGRVDIAGTTDSADFPASGYGGGRDAFVARVTPAGLGVTRLSTSLAGTRTGHVVPFLRAPSCSKRSGLEYLCTDVYPVGTRVMVIGTAPYGSTVRLDGACSAPASATSTSCTLTVNELPHVTATTMLADSATTTPSPSPTADPTPTSTAEPTPTPTVEPTTGPVFWPFPLPTATATFEPSLVPVADPTFTPASPPTPTPTSPPVSAVPSPHRQALADPGLHVTARCDRRCHHVVVAGSIDPRADGERLIIEARDVPIVAGRFRARFSGPHRRFTVFYAGNTALRAKQLIRRAH